MTTNRRDRDRQQCPRCGKTVTVRRDGGLMAHRRADDSAPCVLPAWMRQQARCADCGQLGATTGHMECAYPGGAS